MDNVLKLVDSDPSFMMAGVRCLYMPVPLRQTITSILMQCRTKVGRRAGEPLEMDSPYNAKSLSIRTS